MQFRELFFDLEAAAKYLTIKLLITVPLFYRDVANNEIRW